MGNIPSWILETRKEDGYSMMSRGRTRRAKIFVRNGVLLGGRRLIGLLRGTAYWLLR